MTTKVSSLTPSRKYLLKLASADASSILEAHRRVAQKAGGLLSNFMSPTKSRESANE